MLAFLAMETFEGQQFPLEILIPAGAQEWLVQCRDLTRKLLNLTYLLQLVGTQSVQDSVLGWLLCSSRGQQVHIPSDAVVLPACLLSVQTWLHSHYCAWLFDIQKLC